MADAPIGQDTATRYRAALLRLLEALASISAELQGCRRKETRTLVRGIIDRAEEDARKILYGRPDPDTMQQARQLAAAEMYRALEVFELLDTGELERPSVFDGMLNAAELKEIMQSGRPMAEDVYNAWINFPHEPVETPRTLMRSALALARGQAGAKPQPQNEPHERNEDQ